jgi:hypothetical protein
MFVLSGNVWCPRRHAWFVVLLGLVSVAHLWSHAVHAPYHPHTHVTVSHDGHEHENHDDHGEEAHSHLFVTPTASTVPIGPVEWAVVLVLPAAPGPGQAPAAMGRSPPGDYRGRAALTQTLEVCRC